MQIKVHQLVAALCVVSTALLVEISTAAQPKPGDGDNASRLRALILSGGDEEDWRSRASLLRDVLVNSGRFDVRVTEVPSGTGAEVLAQFDVVVDDYDGPPLGSTTESALDAFVASGKGLVVTSAGLRSLANSNSGDRKLVALTKISPLPDAPTNAPFHLIELKQVRADHPIIQGLKANLRTGDRPLHDFVLQSGAQLLAVSDANEPLLFASAYGRGRVFCSALGHDLGAMQEPAYITTFVRGTEWAASGSVTLPPEITLPGPNTNGVRVLVITGGHDHETSFYGLFDGYKDIGWAPVADSKLAFQKDIRAKYDVLVFYDFTRDLDETGRKNLRDFVESGKGIVVLHHGILNFQKWPWWYEEVVGGLYRLERQGSVPNSTVKFGEEHWITAAGPHPITDGITPFHVIDETYKGLFISTNIQPLLVTDNPTSDRTVAWIGPCRTSKVVFIQLGHDHSPFRHPSYRALVHNAILWTAGKLN